ncbi:PhoP regulatory network protein YrbL [Thermodesulfobacteriota bacterium]
MLILESSQLIGRGLRRECYFHPEDGSKCIKVVVAGDHEETVREQSYYRLLEKRNISWGMLARFYGNVETNRGEGAIFELVRDYNGEVSKTLEQYFSANNETDLNYQDLSRALPLLKQYLLKWKIVTMALKPQNIVYQKIHESEGVLVVIDNIGNSDFIPICTYVNWMAAQKIRRKWQRFEESIEKDYTRNRALQKMVGNLN